MDPFLENLLGGGENIAWSSSPLGDCSQDVAVDRVSPILCDTQGSAFPGRGSPQQRFSPGSDDSLAGGSSSATVHRRKKKSTPKTCRTTWAPAEQELLVSAWLNVSQDPIVGTDQSSNTYWERILEYFNRHKEPSWMDRSLKGAINHWQAISLQGSKFAGHWKRVEDLNPSGTTREDRIAMALKMYKEVEGKPFPFMHLWPMLCDHPKWATHIVSKRQKTHGTASPGTSSAGGGSGEHSPEPMELPTPMGRDAAKRARARGASPSASHASSGSGGTYAAEFQQMNEHKAALVDIKRRQVDIWEAAEEERIINIDLSTKQGTAREYYMKRQQEIMQKRFGNMSS